jgi:hypothetical protein
MSNFCIELTLDLNDQTCNNSSLVLLNSDGTGTAEWFTYIQNGDSIVFKLSDMTSPWDGNRTPTSAHIGVTPISPSGPYDYPFETPPPLSIPLFLEEPSVSYVTPGCQHVYDFGAPPPNELSLTVGTSPIRFNLSIQILDQNGQLMSQHDPEIFIGPD